MTPPQLIFSPLQATTTAASDRTLFHPCPDRRGMTWNTSGLIIMSPIQFESILRVGAYIL